MHECPIKPAAFAVTVFDTALSLALMFCFISVFFFNFLNILIGSAGIRELKGEATLRLSKREGAGSVDSLRCLGEGDRSLQVTASLGECGDRTLGVG